MGDAGKRSVQLGWFEASRPWWRDRDSGPEIEDSYEGEGPRLPGVVLLSDDGVTVSGVASGQKAGRSDTFRKKARFTDWTSFEAFAIQDPLAGLKGPTGASAVRTSSSKMGAFTQAASAGILGWLRSNSTEAHVAIDELVRRQQLPAWLVDDSSEGHLAYSQQYDGLRVGLEIAGFDRTTALELLHHPETPENLPLASLLEDQIINNDVWKFLDWENVPHVVSGAVFRDPWTGRQLRTFLANKLPVEQQTGADIIYYLEELRAFVLVQYKRCVSDRGQLRYRLDPQLTKELDRLGDLQKLVTASPAANLSDHRIGTPFCFVKLCEPQQPLEAAISRGKYFDLHGFELSIVEGPRGGRKIDYQDVDRYINNTLFVELVSQGWVGSAGDVSEQVLKTLEASLDNNRSVLLASISFGAYSGSRGPGSTRIEARSIPPKTLGAS